MDFNRGGACINDGIICFLSSTGVGVKISARNHGSVQPKRVLQHNTCQVMAINRVGASH